MGAQLKENEEFRNAMAEQELKKKMGMGESVMDDRSNSNSSFGGNSTF